MNSTKVFAFRYSTIIANARCHVLERKMFSIGGDGFGTVSQMYCSHGARTGACDQCPEYELEINGDSECFEN
ncbi:MAG TPA: hypothetical protein V6C89_21895 [Drouetiella sp.]